MNSALMTIDETRPASRSEPTSRRSGINETAAGLKTLIVDLCGGLGSELIARGTAATGDALLISAHRLPEFAGTWMSVAEFAAGTGPLGNSRSNSHQPDRAHSRLVLFLPPEPTKSHAAAIDRCIAFADSSRPCRVCLVGSIRVHNGSDELSAFEESAISRLQNAAASMIVVRAGHIIDSDRYRPASWARFAAWYPLVPRNITGVFLTCEELSSAVDRASRAESGGRCRRLTLLGTRRPLREALAEFVRPGVLTTLIVALAGVLSWLQFGRIAGLVAIVVGRYYRPLGRWQFSTLNPRSVEELLSLCHPLNRRHVALAGYNTGVNHFGWKYPGRTVVRTTGSGRLVRIRENSVTVDAGVLLKSVIHDLAVRGKELYVVPNYSYVSMGTTFIVPVHGSGSEVSTLGETIEQVLVYDPAADKILRLRRGDDRFGRSLYNPSSGMLVLRMRLRIRDKSRYFVKRSQLHSPSADEIWQVFLDPDAANVELRKSRAAVSSVNVSKYYTTSTRDPDTLEVPRDSIGRLWDRLEENLVTAWLFHSYVRKYGFHVELFLNEREFDIFWRAHATFPLSKLQLRLVNHDGLPGSPFGDCDRISVDIFMARRSCAPFLSFIKEHLPHARFNPGKHSA